jgi:hypothetical protein
MCGRFVASHDDEEKLMEIPRTLTTARIAQRNGEWYNGGALPWLEFQSSLKLPLMGQAQTGPSRVVI